tara:strand:- start:323 stop:1000 length:678 start_codon:yes stop_codon:yes gene_type:complete
MIIDIEVLKMSWKDILKYDNLSNMKISEFGDQVISSLEALGFEIKYSDHYENMSWMTEKDKKKMKYREFTTLSDEEMEDYDGSYGQETFGHELIITDMDEPYAYRQGFGSDKMTIRYLPDNYDLYYNPRNPDYGRLAINSFKIHDIELATQGGKKKIDVKIDLKGWDNSRQGVRDFVQAILKAFKEYAQYEEDWGDMSEEEQREFRGEMAGHRFAANARSLGYRD